VGTLVLGLDVVDRDRLAYALVASDKLVERGVVEFGDLKRLIKRYRPAIVAVDNIREILDNTPRLIKYLRKAPYEVELIQVTAVDQVGQTMESLVAKYFNVKAAKLSPEDTAEYAARLASKGVGSVVKFYEDETVIKVFKRISTTQGGASRSRFERNVAHRIRQLAQEIRRELDAAGLDYDVFILDRSEDVKSATFIVYAPKSIVRRTVRRRSSVDVAVRIESSPTNRIRLIPLGAVEESKEAPRVPRPVIVGVDPGVRTGIAVLDLRGNVLATYSGKNLGRLKAVKLIYNYGTPVIIATDTSNPPEYVRKLASMVGAKLFVPDRDLSTEEKVELVQRLGGSVKNVHQRDALAAGYKAFLAYKDKLEKAEEEARRANLKDVDRVKVLVIQGYSIKDAVESVAQSGEDRVEERVVVQTAHVRRDNFRDKYEECRARYSKLLEIVGRLERENAELRERLEDAISRCSSTSSQTLEVRLEELNRRYMEALERLNELRNLLNIVRETLFTDKYAFASIGGKTDYTVVKYNDFVGNVDQYVGKVVLVEGLSDGESAKFAEREVVAIPLEKVLVGKISEDLYVVDKGRVEEMKRMLVEIIAARMGEMTKDRIAKIINTYRVQRRV